MNQFLLTIVVTSDDIGPSVAALANQYGDVRVQALSYAQGFDDESAALTDDEAATDIVGLLSPDQLLASFHEAAANLTSTDGTTVAQVEGLINDIQGAMPALSASNAALREAEILVVALKSVAADMAIVADSDPTPPHGIERPHLPDTYWVDPRLAKTQGSGEKQSGLEDVPCPTCNAPVGAVCMAASHAGYRRGFGHSSRRAAHRASLRTQ